MMIVVAIIAILAAIAMPIYRDYIIRTRLSEVQGLMSGARTSLEQYYQDNRNYGPTTGTACGGTLPASNYFTFTCTTSNSGQAFVLQAQAKAAPVMGFTYTVDQTNLRQTTAAPARWSQSTTCWTTRKDGSCS
ncbi:hypothetical protein KPL74_01460 [Bacillus sp. NP157]|nr:hypothetical protein KPL74_01460 [Bacillus sp. NP157]